VDNGFYYEMALPGGAAVQASDWAPLESIVGKIVKEKQPFQRLVRPNIADTAKVANNASGNEQGGLAEDVCIQPLQAAHHQGQD